MVLGALRSNLTGVSLNIGLLDTSLKSISFGLKTSFGINIYHQYHFNSSTRLNFPNQF
jgi:hypothetical protein